MRNDKLTVIVDIKRLFRICDEFFPFLSQNDYNEVIRYKLSKENCYDVEGFSHQHVSSFTHMLLNQIQNAGGFFIRLPPGVISIGEITTNKTTARIVCSGKGGVFNSDGTVRSADSPLRLGVQRQAERQRDRRLDFILGDRLPGTSNAVRVILGI